MQASLSFRVFHNILVIDLELRELDSKHLSISHRGTAMEWRTQTNVKLSGKTTFRWCARQRRVGWQFVLQQTSPNYTFSFLQLYYRQLIEPYCTFTNFHSLRWNSDGQFSISVSLHFRELSVPQKGSFHRFRDIDI